MILDLLKKFIVLPVLEFEENHASIPNLYITLPIIR
jgi:hypothetical protein